MAKQLMLLITTAVALGGSSPVMSQETDVWIVGNFEKKCAWEGLSRSSEQAAGGSFSGKWSNLTDTPSIRAPGFPADISRYDRLIFSLYSDTATGQKLTLVLDSENPDDPDGWDYYFYHFRVNWQGWKTFNLRLGTDIRATRKPLGYDRIKYFSINAGGWQHHPLKDTLLYIDDVMFVRDTVALDAVKQGTTVDGRVLQTEWTVHVTNRAAAARHIPLTANLPDDLQGKLHLQGLPERTTLLQPGQSTQLAVTLAMDALNAAPLSRFSVQISAVPANDSSPGPSRTLSAVVPLPQRDHPFLFGDKALFRRARERARELDWAAKQLDNIMRTAEQHLERPLQIPDMAGQWSHHYVCKACGNRLRHDPPKHVCQHCGAVYSGWPYDQVVAAGRHGANFRQAKELALAYTLSGKNDFAKRARDIFLGYAARYTNWPLHNVRGKLSNSAGRVFAQTLDEGVSAIGLAWAYDMIYDSPVVSTEDRAKIEEGLLRPMVKTIRRNNAGISNWQSWHNAGVAAIGFCLQDAEMVSHALQGKSGFEFQLEHSILSDGFWYEGTAAYHYYALNALRWTAEAAWFAGIDYWKQPAYRSLYDAPLLYTFPNLDFPAVNDSDIFSIKGQHPLYEVAYARTQNPTYLNVAQFGNRQSLEAFLFGADELPPVPAEPLASRVFGGIGAAVMRQAHPTGPIYLHLDYGPHGGGHGHQDKLAIILFAMGRQLAPDPGRLAYGAPLQGAWYKQTVAHNTICVDAQSQRATEGRLTAFEDTPQGAFMQAECDTAYEGVLLRRSLVLVDGVLVDMFEARSDKPHTYDWVYHNVGAVTSTLDFSERGEPIAPGAGYQHISAVREDRTDNAWAVSFEQAEGRVQLTMAAAPETTVLTGVGYMNNPPAPCPLVIARRQAKTTLFASVIEPTQGKARVSGLTVISTPRDDEIAVSIEMPRQTIDILVAQSAGVERSLNGTVTDGRLLILKRPRRSSRRP